MKKTTADVISSYLEQRSSDASPAFTIQRIQVASPLVNFHPWADHKPLVSAHRILRNDGTELFFLLIDWRQKDEWYLVVCSPQNHAPLVEIWREEATIGAINLQWTYKPVKRDGLNRARVDFFRRHFIDVNLVLSVPVPHDRDLRFIQDVFDLVDRRVKADELSAM